MVYKFHPISIVTSTPNVSYGRIDAKILVESVKVVGHHLKQTGLQNRTISNK